MGLDSRLADAGDSGGDRRRRRHRTATKTGSTKAAPLGLILLVGRTVITAGWFAISMWRRRRHVLDDNAWRAHQRRGRAR